MSEEPFDSSFIDAFASRIGVESIDIDVVSALLELAGDAARDSGDRRNAPITCFLAGVLLGAGGGAVTAASVSSLRAS